MALFEEALAGMRRGEAWEVDHPSFDAHLRPFTLKALEGWLLGSAVILSSKWRKSGAPHLAVVHPPGTAERMGPGFYVPKREDA